MTSVLKGNFETKKKVSAETSQQETLEGRFEREALNSLGGSIAFVSKKLVKWSDDEK